MIIDLLLCRSERTKKRTSSLFICVGIIESQYSSVFSWCHIECDIYMMGVNVWYVYLEVEYHYQRCIDNQLGLSERDFWSIIYSHRRWYLIRREKKPDDLMTRTCFLPFLTSVVSFIRLEFSSGNMPDDIRLRHAPSGTFEDNLLIFFENFILIRFHRNVENFWRG